MGVAVSSLPGQDTPVAWLINTHPRQGPRYLQWPGLDSCTRMNFLKIVASFLFLVSVSLSSTLHIRARRSDGYNDVGGVYNSAIAQDYWASRFGSGFFAGLRALQLDGEAADSGVLP